MTDDKAVTVKEEYLSNEDGNKPISKSNSSFLDQLLQINNGYEQQLDVLSEKTNQSNKQTTS